MTEGQQLRREQTRTVLQILLALTLVTGGMYSLPPTDVKAAGRPTVPYKLGNWSCISKPVYPVKINASQIPVGNDWTYVYTLSASSSYHVYIYGDWIGSATDYDVYVYNPRGTLETIHTEAAGLPEHLGTTVTEPFFTPQYSGDYSLHIVNDPRESQGEDAATLMIIEHIDCNRWYERALQGKVNHVNVHKTTWAYEFVTASERVELWIDVPDTLDMYEARLYIMANPSKGIGGILNGVPLAWEPGVYNTIHPSGVYGGYNLDDEGFKHPRATASCEYPGQDMLINYTSPCKGDMLLYHLVFVGEHGEGDIRFMVKTDFEAPSLSVQNPVERVESERETTITAEVYDQDSGLNSVLLSYTNDDWENWASVEMSPSQNQEYVGTIPGQPAGSTVKYRITASDRAGNVAEGESDYIVKDTTTLTFSLSKPVIYANEDIAVTGQISHGGVKVRLTYTCEDETVLRIVTAGSTGSFIDEYAPRKVGNWTVSASWQGDETHFEVFSGYKDFTVQKVPTSVDFTLSKEDINIGEEITITGIVEPALENVIVELEFIMPNKSVTSRYSHTSSDGTYNIDFAPDLEGTWSIQTKLAGDPILLPSSSMCKSFTVQKVPTSVDCISNKEAMKIGEEITITGKIEPALGNIRVLVRFTKPGGKTIEKYVQTGSNGSFDTDFAPDLEGSWSVQAEFPGDAVYLPSFSGSKDFTVQKVPTSVDFRLSEEAINLGEEICIAGTVQPALENRIVELEITMPNESIIKRHAYTGSDGSFNADFVPDSEGSWSVQAKLAGDAVYLPASSESKPFVVSNTWMNIIISFANQYMMYIIVAVAAAASISGVLVYLRRRE